MTAARWGAALLGAATLGSALHSRQAATLAWQRAKCGRGDLVTQWGAAVDPAQVLPEYPRPQMTRAADTAYIMNGIWEHEFASGFDEPVPFGRALNGTILVPFPVEACLSGVGVTGKFMYYRTVFDSPFPGAPGALLHFGAVDWNATVYLNGAALGTHIGGYDGFSYDVTAALQAANNELIVFVYDPSDEGYQPHGKQRISAIAQPGGDTYAPSSGIWQTVWLEAVPPYRVDSLKIVADTRAVTVTVATAPAVPGTASITVSLGGAVVATASGDTFMAITVPIASPQLWHPDHPTLYSLNVTVTEPSTANTDAVGSYFGMRNVTLGAYTTPATNGTGASVGIDNAGGDLPGMPLILNASDYNLCWALCNQTAACVAWSYGVPSCGGDPAKPQCWLKGTAEGTSANACRVSGSQPQPGYPGMRPLLNGEFTFFNGWLDQSWWPDGEYTAPSDAALAFDLQAVKAFGMNTVRLHQKVNSERWYFWADVLGVVVLQDAVQKYGGASPATVEPFLADLKAMVDGRFNHPSIVQWDVFNEGDCVGQFNASAVVAWVQAYDPSRLVDTNSGGPANDYHVGDVNDIHSYPWPGSPKPSATQYAMIGEYGGIGAFINGHEWVPGGCYAYMKTPTPANESATFVEMAGMIQAEKGFVSASIFTQITDVEEECDGFYTMDRVNKFDAAQQAAIVAANQALINA